MTSAPPDDETEAGQPPVPGDEDGPSADWLASAGARAGLSAGAMDALVGWLAEQVESDSYAQLERAGHANEDRIPLARVFVDLQVARTPESQAGETELFLDLLCQPGDKRRGSHQL